MPKSDVENTPRKVFISYSHKDEGWKKKCLPHLKALEQAGVDMVVWEDRQIDAGEKWYPAIQQAMADAAVSVLLISPDYLASNFCVKEEVPYLLKRQEHEGMLLIPVLVHQCPWKAHRWLADRQMLPRDGKCVAIDFPGARANLVFAEVADRICDFLKGGGGPVLTTMQPKWPPLPPGYIDLTRLPETGAALFGRDEELKLLDQAWSSGETPGSGQTRVLALVAYGGVGKSTLVSHWLREMQRDQFRGATRVFGWSFYSQGAREEGMASADTFIDAALRFFGDPDPASGSPWDKGERLARLAGAECALLVLDGMEPLQSGHTFDKGKLRDPALESLLRGLARGSRGLCLVTTREPASDLADQPGFASRDLEQISPEAGRALLRAARVVGADGELETLAARFGPHALAVSLLGVYLHEKDPHGGIGPAKALEQMPGKGPIDRVLAGFEQWLAGTAELEVLRMLGLFERPADAGCLGALRAKPPIPSLTDRVVKLGKADWDRILARLERLRLVHVRHKDSGKPVVDAHPLLREHFAQQLREQHPDAWRAGHRRLYEHLCATTKEGDQPTLADLQPLYQAVAHGCQAGLHQKAILEVYWWRIQRKLAGYSHRCLGAFGAELAMLSAFFESGWTQPSRNLRDFWQAIVLGFAAARFRSLGWLDDATRLFQASLKAHRCQGDMWLAGTRARQLADVYTQLGRLAEAKEQAEEAVSLGDKAAALATDKTYLSRYEAEGFESITRDDVVYECVVQRVALGGALLQLGQTRDAKQAFRLAERLQKRTWADLPVLFSIWGARYCRLLLGGIPMGNKSDCGRYKRIVRRISQMRRTRQQANKMQIPKGYWGLLEKALEQEVGALAKARLSLAQGRSVPLESAEEIDSAVESLRRTGRQDFICHGLLTRMALRCEIKDSAEATRDLNEAWRIAERGPMNLDLADIHLYRARLFHGVTPYPWDKDPQGKPRGPKDDLAAARKLIEQCGYHRRDEELADAEEAAKSW